MSLDLLDRKGKYSNGFCHWPQPAWLKPDGSWQPTVTHFTSLADPAAIGSGLTGLTTLMHEAGHAAALRTLSLTPTPTPTLTPTLTLTLTLTLATNPGPSQARGALRQHPDALAALQPRACAHLGRVRRAAEHVP